METFKASLDRKDKSTSLIFTVRGRKLSIILTEDKPNDVKGVFNKFIEELKNGVFNFKLEDSKEDLYSNISKEYILQLNTELESIYHELKDYDLLNRGGSDSEKKDKV